MSNGLNGLLMANVQAFLNAHPLETALLAHHLYQPAPGVSHYDLMRAEHWPADHGAILISMPAGGGRGDPPILAYWLAQRGHVDVPLVGPPATFIFTPELTGCKIRVDRIGLHTYRVFHMQHDPADYPQALRGNCRVTVDSHVDYPGGRCAALLHYDAATGWTIWIQQLTGVVGVGGGALVYPAGAPAVTGVHEHRVP